MCRLRQLALAPAGTSSGQPHSALAGWAGGHTCPLRRCHHLDRPSEAPQRHQQIKAGLQGAGAGVGRSRSMWLDISQHQQKEGGGGGAMMGLHSSQLCRLLMLPQALLLLLRDSAQAGAHRSDSC